MGAKARRRCLVAVACCCAALEGCGHAPRRLSEQPAARTPLPAPRVVLSAHDRAAWMPRAPDRSVVPILVYRGVGAEGDGIDPRAFARQMVLLDHAGYQTITLDRFVRFVRREPVRL